MLGSWIGIANLEIVRKIYWMASSAFIVFMSSYNSKVSILIGKVNTKTRLYGFLIKINNSNIHAQYYEFIQIN